VVDGYNREALVIEVDLNLPSTRVARALKRIAAWQGYLLLKVRMDNGPKFMTVTLADWADSNNV
jgi:putative transposase